jgi:hypothetical protein
VLPEFEELATVLVCEDDDPTGELLCDHLTRIASGPRTTDPATAAHGISAAGLG